MSTNEQETVLETIDQNEAALQTEKSNAERTTKTQQENVVEKKIRRFAVSNAPTYQMVYALRCLGVDLCHEAASGRQEWYVDALGNSAFPAHSIHSIELDNATVRDVMDHICAADKRYAWAYDSKRNVVNLFPRENSVLSDSVGPVVTPHTPEMLIPLLSKGLLRKPIDTTYIAGLSTVAGVQVTIPTCTFREALNEVVKDNPGVAWALVGNRLAFDRVTSNVQTVQLTYPPLTKSLDKALAATTRYSIVERQAAGIVTLVLEKKPISKSTVKCSAFGERKRGHSTPVRHDDCNAWRAEKVSGTFISLSCVLSARFKTLRRLERLPLTPIPT